MPLYERISYSAHANARMRKRRISRENVVLALRIGEGYEEDDGTTVYKLGRIRVIILDRGTEAHIVTVIELRGLA